MDADMGRPSRCEFDCRTQRQYLLSALFARSVVKPNSKVDLFPALRLLLRRSHEGPRYPFQFHR